MPGWPEGEGVTYDNGVYDDIGVAGPNEAGLGNPNDPAGVGVTAAVPCQGE